MKISFRFASKQTEDCYQNYNSYNLFLFTSKQTKNYYKNRRKIVTKTDAKLLLKQTENCHQNRRKIVTKTDGKLLPKQTKIITKIVL